MEQLLTANVATNLYWLGRYLERIELTLTQINKAYDKIIDVDKEAGVELYKKFDIELKYTGVYDFLDQAIRGDHSANIANLMVNARENTIIARPNIDASTFGEIIELHSLFQKIAKSPLHIDYNDIDTALSLISEIWGVYDRKGKRKCSHYFLKLGKLIEEVDFRLRFNRKTEVTNLILNDIDFILKTLGSDTAEQPSQSQTQSSNDLMQTLYQRVDELIVID